MKSASLSVVIAVVFCLNPHSLSAAGITELKFTSTITSWVGKGQSRDIVPSQGYDFWSETTDQNVVGGNTAGLLFTIKTPTYSDYWYLNLVGPNFTQPVVGFYPNAHRFLIPPLTSPGMDFEGNHAGDNTLTGQFQVLEATFDSAGKALSYAVDFIQYDGGSPSAWVQGSFRYNSTIPVPEPSTLALLTLGAFGLIARLIGIQAGAVSAH